jgi:hypothetical protein
MGPSCHRSRHRHGFCAGHSCERRTGEALTEPDLRLRPLPHSAATGAAVVPLCDLVIFARGEALGLTPPWEGATSPEHVDAAAHEARRAAASGALSRGSRPRFAAVDPALPVAICRLRGSALAAASRPRAQFEGPRAAGVGTAAAVGAATVAALDTAASAGKARSRSNCMFAFVGALPLPRRCRIRCAVSPGGGEALKVSEGTTSSEGAPASWSSERRSDMAATTAASRAAAAAVAAVAALPDGMPFCTHTWNSAAVAAASVLLSFVILDRLPLPSTCSPGSMTDRGEDGPRSSGLSVAFGIAAAPASRAPPPSRQHLRARMAVWVARRDSASVFRGVISSQPRAAHTAATMPCSGGRIKG